MKNNASFIYSFVLVLSDALTLVAAFVGAYILRVSISHRAIANAVPAKTYLLILLALVPVWIVIFSLIGLYNREIYDKRFNEISRLFVGSALGSLFIVSIAFFSNKPIFPAKLVPIYGSVLTFLLLVITRNVARAIRHLMFRYNKGISNVLIVGNTASAKELINWLADPVISGYRVIGIVGPKNGLNLRYFHDFDEAIRSIGKKQLHSIMQTELFADTEKNDEILSYAQSHHVSYRFIPGNTELFVGKLDVELFQSSIPMIAVHQTALIGWGRVAKRLFDILVSALLIVLFAPLMAIIALLNIIFTRGVFFRQKRLTRFNRDFKVFKFQTIKKPYNGLSPEQAFAKMKRPELAETYRNNGDFLADDPRMTSFGRFLRRTSLDELPQLFNVIRGDISLVGPRPLISDELDKYAKKHTILSVKSGLTGLAQVSGRKHISFDERRKLDTFYVQNWSFWLDLVILAKTIRVVLSGEGAR